MAESEITVEGLFETLAAFRYLPKAASQALRERSLELAGTLASDVQSAARAEGGQAALMAGLIKAKRDRIPAVKAGGSRRVGRNRAPAFKLLFGAEFGADQYPQFKPHRGTRGYFMFPTIRGNDAIPQAWQDVADDIGRAFVRGGGA